MNGTLNSSFYFDKRVTRHYLADGNIMLIPMIFLGCLFAVGIPGNVLVLVIYGLKYKPSVYRTIIVVLGVNDLMLCLVTLPFEFCYMIFYISFQAKWVCKIFRFFNYFIVLNSVLVLTLMAIERYRRVCHPLKVQMTMKIGRICMFVMFLFAVLYNIPNFFIRGIQTTRLHDNITIYECSTSDDYIKSYFPAIVGATSLFLCFCFITIVVVLYVAIGRQIYKHFRFIDRIKLEHTGSTKASISDNGMSNSQTFSDIGIDSIEKPHTPSMSRKLSIIRKWSTRKPNGVTCRKSVDLDSHKSTKIAIAITVCFIFSYIPNLALSTLSGIYGEAFLTKHMSLSVFHLLLRTYTINHVVNPFIYGFIDRKFRFDCKNIFRQLCQKCRQIP